MGWVVATWTQPTAVNSFLPSNRSVADRIRSWSSHRGEVTSSLGKSSVQLTVGQLPVQTSPFCLKLDFKWYFKWLLRATKNKIWNVFSSPLLRMKNWNASNKPRLTEKMGCQGAYVTVSHGHQKIYNNHPIKFLTLGFRLKMCGKMAKKIHWIFVFWGAILTHLQISKCLLWGTSNLSSIGNLCSSESFKMTKDSQPTSMRYNPISHKLQVATRSHRSIECYCIRKDAMLLKRLSSSNKNFQMSTNEW